MVVAAAARAAAALLVVCSVAALAAAPDGWPWTHTRSADADPARLPTKLGADDPLWTYTPPGPGASMPLLWGEAIVVTCELGDENGLVFLDHAGKELWRSRGLGKASLAKHRNATGANSTPVADDERVYAYYKDSTLAAIDRQGEVAWSFRLAERFGEGVLWWDMGSSPVLTSKHLVVAAIHEGESYLAAFDRATGETVWKTPRVYKRPEESDQAYTTPAVVSVDGRETIVTWGADYLTGHAADTGELLWEAGGFNPNNQEMWRAIASAAVADSVAFVPHGRGDLLSAVRLGGEGDVTQSSLVWRRSGVGADVPTPCVQGDALYLLRDRGEFLCLDAATGETRWSGKLPRSRSNYYASPLVVGDRLYALREDGAAFVCRLDNGLEVLGEYELPGPIVATPVVWGDRLLVRTRDRLCCFAGSEAE